MKSFTKFFTKKVKVILVVALIGIVLFVAFHPLYPINLEGYSYIINKHNDDDDDCFHPETKVKLQNGNVVEMQHLQLDDILENNNSIRSIMKVRNTKKVKYYKFEKCGVNDEDIYVTGRHLVLGHDGQFISVENHPDAIIEETIEAKWFSCLITQNHQIQIGNKTFWDWEDYKCSK